VYGAQSEKQEAPSLCPACSDRYDDLAAKQQQISEFR
jgi:hypothetical protein